MGDVAQQIGAFLKKNRFGVLCACTQEQPRATPVRYWSAGLTINVFSEKYTAKFHVLKKNRRVAFGIYNSRPVRGLQLWGKAEVITCEDPRHDACLPPQIKKNPRMRAACKVLNLIQITPSKILLLDMSRKGNKYLLWQKARGGTEIEKEIQTVRQASTL